MSHFPCVGSNKRVAHHTSAARESRRWHWSVWKPKTKKSYNVGSKSSKCCINWSIQILQTWLIWMSWAMSWCPEKTMGIGYPDGHVNSGTSAVSTQILSFQICKFLRKSHRWKRQGPGAGLSDLLKVGGGGSELQRWLHPGRGRSKGRCLGELLVRDWGEFESESETQHGQIKKVMISPGIFVGTPNYMIESWITQYTYWTWYFS